MASAISPEVRTYAYGGFRIESAVPLDTILPAASADRTGSSERLTLALRFVPEPVTSACVHVHAWVGRFGLSLWRLGDDWVFRSTLGAEFRVDGPGRTITCYPGPLGWSATTTEVFVRRVLPRVAQLHGRVALHAAALAAGRGAVLLYGPSGAGKSTLAAALVRGLGWQLLSDDVALLGEHDGRLLAHASGGGICLWPDSRQALAGSADGWGEIAAYRTKLRGLQSPASPEPQPVRVCYRLGNVPASGSPPSHPVTVTDLQPAERVRSLAGQVVRFDPTDRAAEARRLPLLGRLANSLPVRSLCYPRRYDALPQVVDFLARAHEQ